MKAFVLIKIRTGEIELVLRDLHRIPSVTDAYMTFGPYDTIAMIEADDLSKIGQIVYTEIQPIPGVQNTLTCLAIETEISSGKKAGLFSAKKGQFHPN